MLGGGHRGGERAEQLGIELVRQRDVEGLGGALAVLDLRDGVAQCIDLPIQLLRVACNFTERAKDWVISIA